MKTHRMYRQQREETPNILVLKPNDDHQLDAHLGALYSLLGSGHVLNAPNTLVVRYEQVSGKHAMNPMCKCEVSHE